MPTRYLKESICTSEQIDALTPFEETVFYRLIVTVDDYGRMDGRIPILRSKLFPLKDIRAAQIESALQSLSSQELVERYKVNGKPFVRLTGWLHHQNIRAAKSKYPGPETAADGHSACNFVQPYANADNCMQMTTDDYTCNQMLTDADNCTQMITDSSVIEIDNRNRESKSYLCAEPETASAPTAAEESPVVITLILNTGEEYPITQKVVDELAPIYPGVDVMAELRAMKGWSIGNPPKRKTRRGVMKFITNWLSNSQDAAARRSIAASRTQGTTKQEYQAGENGVDIQPGENPFRR